MWLSWQLLRSAQRYCEWQGIDVLGLRCLDKPGCLLGRLWSKVLRPTVESTVPAILLKSFYVLPERSSSVSPHFTFSQAESSKTPWFGKIPLLMEVKCYGAWFNHMHIHHVERQSDAGIFSKCAKKKKVTVHRWSFALVRDATVKIDAAEPRIVLFHAFLFLVETWQPTSPAVQLDARSLAGDSGHHLMQFMRLHAAPSEATKVFIQMFSHIELYSPRPVSRLWCVPP